MLDFVLDDAKRLHNRASGSDRVKLEEYLTSVREAEIRTRRADAWLDTPLPTISEADRKRTDRDINAAMAGDYFRTVYDLMVLAFQTDVTRVATFSLGGEGDGDGLEEGDELRVEVESVPQISRHDGYETAFLAGLHPDDRDRADRAVAASLSPSLPGKSPPV